MTEDLATAHHAWDRAWTTDAERKRWLAPDPLVQQLVPLLRSRSFQRVLDVGCGIGRHAHFLARSGFQCAGVDASVNGLAVARDNAVADGLAIDYRVGPFYDLPFNDGAFDAVIAWNVIYHGDGEIVQRAVDDIARVLVPGGLLVGTMLSTRNRGYGRGHEVRPNTFVVDDATDDKVHPHYYCDAPTLLALYRSFEVLLLRDNERTPGANHWEYTFERR